MFKRKTIPVLFVAVASLISGCKIITAGVVAVAAVVGLAGYVVYKTGDVAVTGVGKAARATGDAVSSGSKSMATIIFANGELKTDSVQDVRTVWTASSLAFRKANFSEIQGTFDALSGGLTARTLDNMEIILKVRSMGPHATEVRIRAGVTGNLKIAELIHGLILRELPPTATPRAAPAIKEEVKP